MRKEVIISIVAGIILGVIIAFGIWRINSSLETEKKATKPINQPEAEKITPSEDFPITLSNSDNFDVVTKQPVTIKGLTKANSKLIISAEEEDYIYKADESGEFSAEVNLVGGTNQLLFLSVDENNETNSKELVLIYSTEFEK